MQSRFYHAVVNSLLALGRLLGFCDVASLFNYSQDRLTYHHRICHYRVNKDMILVLDRELAHSNNRFFVHTILHDLYDLLFIFYFNLC